MLILKDTLLLILIPALIGVISGLIISTVAPFEEIGLQGKIDFVLITGSICGIFLFTIVSGIIPAVRAVQMNPSEVLRGQVAPKREKQRNGLTIVFFGVTCFIIAVGAYINFTLEEGYKKDIMNSTGAPPATTEKAPSFSFTDSSGNRISSDTLENQNYCLVIWESNCSASHQVLIELNQLVVEGKLKSNEIYAVSLDQDVQGVKDYIDQNQLLIEPYIDDNQSTKWAFNANIVPAVYVINQDGVIHARLIGWSNEAKEYISDSFIMHEKIE